MNESQLFQSVVFKQGGFFFFLQDLFCAGWKTCFEASVTCVHLAVYTGPEPEPLKSLGGFPLTCD